MSSQNGRNKELLPTRREALQAAAVTALMAGFLSADLLQAQELNVDTQPGEQEPSPELPDAFPLFFPDTNNEQLGYHLEGPLQDVWRAHAHGLVWGQPISSMIEDDDGSLIQYFQSGGLRLDPDTQEVSYLPLGRQFLEATGDTYADFYISPEEVGSVELVNRYFITLHGGTEAFGKPLTRPIPLQSNQNDKMQIFENLVLVEHDTIEVEPQFQRTYTELYHPNKQLEWGRGRSPLLWPGETYTLPVAEILKENGFIAGDAEVIRSEAIPYRPDLWQAQQQIIVNTNYYGQRLLAVEGDLVVLEIPISSGREEAGYFTPITTNEGTRIVDWDELADYVSPFPNDPYTVRYVPWNMNLDHNRSVFIHGIYWHPMLGRQRSHGCINCTPLHAHWLYNWSSPNTVVIARPDIDTANGLTRTDHLRRLTQPYPTFPLPDDYRLYAEL